jgi:hypothetical protein
MLVARAHKIAVSVAFVLLAAWLLVGSLQPSPLPSQGQSTTEHSTEQNKGGIRETWWQRAINDPTAFFTLWVAVFTAVLSVSTIGLLRATRRSTNIAERALTDLERPWLFHEGTAIEWRGQPGGSSPTNNFWINFKFKNVGRAPALTEECLFQVCEKAKLPSIPSYSSEVRLSIQHVIAVGESAETNKIGPPTGGGELIVYGKLSYRELNGTLHQTGFAVACSPHFPACVGYPDKNYSYYT